MKTYLYAFTVFVPTYNRRHTLGRLLASLKAQTVKDFELIVVDDGSSDGTNLFIDEAKEECDFPIKYIWQYNQGKHVARNKALDIAEGEFFFTIDSDDILLPGALETVLTYWDMIDEQKRDIFAGVEGLDIELGTGRIIGSRFPADIYDADHIRTHYLDNVKGDKSRAILTKVFKEYKYPELNGEKYITEAIVWNRIAKNYILRHINVPLVAVEYMSDGLGARSLAIRTSNPKGTVLYYSEFINDVMRNHKIRYRYIMRNYTNYIRFSYHLGTGIGEQLKGIPSISRYLFCLPFGICLWLVDKRSLRIRRLDENEENI